MAGTNYPYERTGDYLGHMVKSDIEATSTDVVVIENKEPATVGVPVQMSGRIRFRSHAWDVDSGVSRSDDWIMEAKPVSGNTVYSNLFFKRSLDGGAYTSLVNFSTTGYVDAASVADNAIEMATGTWTNTSGDSAAVLIKPTYDQSSGSDTNTDLKISRTETAVMSGSQYHIWAGIGATRKMSVDNTGTLYLANDASVSGNIFTTGYFQLTGGGTIQTTSNGDLFLAPDTNGKVKVKDPGSTDYLGFMHNGTYGEMTVTHYLLMGGAVRMANNIGLYLGTSANYWIHYDTSNTRFAITSTNVDGGGTDGDVIRIEDGSDDVAFLGYTQATYVVASSGTGFLGTRISPSTNDTTLIIQNKDFANSDVGVESLSGTMTQSTGEQLLAFRIKPTYNQSDDASGVDFVVSRTETAVGTGSQLLMDLGVTTDGTYGNHTSRFKVTNTGAVTVVPSTTVVGLTVNQANNAVGLNVDCAATGANAVAITGGGLSSTQDIANRHALYVYRNLNEAGNLPLARFINDNATNTQATVFVDQQGNGYGIQINSEASTVNALQINAAYGMAINQDVTNGRAIYCSRNLNEAGINPLASFINNHASNTQSTIYALQTGAGYVIEVWQNGDAAAILVDANGTSATSYGVQVNAKYCAYFLQNIADGQAIKAYRNRDEAGTYPLVEFLDDHATSTQHVLKARSDSSSATTAAAQFVRAGIAATSTDGILLENTTEASAPTPVQMGPRIRLRGHAWDTDDTTSRSEDWIIENLPVTGNSVTSSLRFGRSSDEGAYSYPMSLTSAGVLTTSTAVVSTYYYSSANDISLILQPRAFTNTDSAVEAVTGTMTQGDGETIVGLHIRPTVNQTATAGSAWLVVSPKETATGSEPQLLIDLGTCSTAGDYSTHTSVFKVANDGATTIVPSAASTGLTINQDNNAKGILVDSEATSANYGISVEAKYGIEVTQDISNGIGLKVTRDIAEVGTLPLVRFKNDNATDTQATLELQNDGSGAHITTGGTNENLEISPNGTGIVSLTGGLTLADKAYLDAGTTTDDYFIIQAYDTGVSMVEVARVVGAADPYFSFGGNEESKFYYSGVVTIGGDTTIADGKNIILNSTTGTKIGTATGQKIGFFNVTPVIQPASANQAALNLDLDVDGSDTVDEAAIDSNFAAIQTLVNQLRTDMVALGLIKGAA
jgi:hypothetical protein